MTTMSTAAGAGVLAHGLHDAMVLAGLWGLAALLLPHALTRPRARLAPHDEHAARVAALRATLTAGTGSSVATAPPVVVPAPRVRPAALSVPLAVVATTAAAGVHAAVAPAHLREQALAGLFFVVAAIAQVAWATAVAGRPTPTLLRVGIVLELALVALWLLTRTTGLPFGLLPEPHPVGAWDLTCVVWQLTAAAACARSLRDGVPRRCPGWFDWHWTSRAAVGAAACSLVLLTLSGAPA